MAEVEHLPTPKLLSGLLYSGGKLVRGDGRAATALRPVEITPHFISSAEGSALIRLGETRVICTASVEDGVPPFLKGTERGWITSEYGMIPRATETRTAREATRGRQGGRTMEIQRLIGRSLRAVTDLEALGERTVWIDCDVIRADGGTRTAAITGSLVALGLALQKLDQLSALRRFPLRDYVAAISVGIVGGETLLDLDYVEDSNAGMDMNVVMTGAGQLVEVQATAEGRPYSVENLNQLLEVARPAIQTLLALQRSILRIELPPKQH
ncbi:MAG: ribonuclease PH [Acidobacteria bacterium]|nr:MAG: ribonuclease PH [Acidobacteriota bacterium]